MGKISITLPPDRAEELLPLVLDRGVPDSADISESPNGTTYVELMVEDDDAFFDWWREIDPKELRRLGRSDLDNAEVLRASATSAALNSRELNAAILRGMVWGITNGTTIESIIVLDVLDTTLVVVDLMVSQRGQGHGYSLASAFAVNCIQRQGIHHILLPGNPPRAMGFLQKWMVVSGLAVTVKVRLVLDPHERQYKGQTCCLLEIGDY